ncbi:major capsid protein [Acrocarpospora sp. B8E8]|uniref:major capsid protein n=1 Tax=Acrocarpospora sp. B8E8 TaxID=3153572 RepID=UPI00325D598D
MPITLAQAQINARSQIDHAVIDNFRRYSYVLDRIVWDDTATPGTGGAALSYGFTLLTEPRTAEFRALNQEYTAGSAVREQRSVNLKPWGGSFTVDRVLSDLGPAQTNEVMFQMQQLLTSTRARAQEEIINGDTAVNANGFDGLDKLLTGSSTEYIPGGSAMYADWSAATVNTQALANSRLDEIDEWLASIVPSTVGGGDQGEPGALPPGEKAILGNTRSIARFRALARWASMYTSEKDELGRLIERYGDWVLVNIGDKSDGSAPIIPIESRDPDGGGGGGTITNLTDLYAVTFGLDTLHGATMAGKPLVRTWLPDFSTSGAVKSGEVEMGPGALVVRNTKGCGVFRGAKVA